MFPFDRIKPFFVLLVLFFKTVLLNYTVTSSRQYF
ncbi:unnamed protein product [Amoebophrya sp. A25]|nr:unnamed protein product [Amoebophrya sp. A25]|eukprot:GSA25T00014437001.1